VAELQAKQLAEQALQMLLAKKVEFVHLVQFEDVPSPLHFSQLRVQARQLPENL